MVRMGVIGIGGMGTGHARMIEKGESKGAVGVLPQQKYDKWAQWPELYEAYLDELSAAPVAAGVARKHKMWLQHEQVSAADLKVIIQAALHLAERIRKAEQGE